MSQSFERDNCLDFALENYSDMVIRIAFQNIKNRVDAQDITQDVFIKLMTAEKQFESPEHLKAWLIRVTINMSHNFVKSSWNTNRAKLTEVAVYESEGMEVLEEVMKLPKSYRNVIYLFYYEGYAIKEISDILGHKQNTVLSWLHRARKKLKAQMIGGFDSE